MLTPKQRDLLAFINLYVKANHGIAPSFEEMAKALGIKSKNTIHRRDLIRACALLANETSM